VKIKFTAKIADFALGTGMLGKHMAFATSYAITLYSIKKDNIMDLKKIILFL